MRRDAVVPTIALLLGLAMRSLAVISTQPTSAPSAEAAAKIESLIPLLGADQWQDRQNAQDQLIAFGDAAVSRLNRLVAETTDTETRTRAESALQLIAENRIAGVSYVTLKFTRAPAKKVIAELARQAWTTLPTEPPTLFADQHFHYVTIDMDKQPFWVALREICKQAGLRPQIAGQDQHLALVASDPSGNSQFDGPLAYSGPFMIVANQAQQTNAVYFAQPLNVTHTLNITFSIFAEPKLHVLSRSYTARIDSAVDDKNHSMTDARQWSQFYPGPEVSSIWSVSAPLVLPRETGTRIVRLQGQCRAILQTQSEVWEIPDLLHGGPRTKTINGRAYSFVELKQDGANYAMKLTTTRDVRFGYNPDLTALQGIRLLDAAGNPFTKMRHQTTGGDAQHWEYTAFFSPHAASDVPTKLIWELPLETQDKDIAFEFKDLPLP